MDDIVSSTDTLRPSREVSFDDVAVVVPMPPPYYAKKRRSGVVTIQHDQSNSTRPSHVIAATVACITGY